MVMRKLTREEFDERVDFFDKMACSSWIVEIQKQMLSTLGSWDHLRVLDIGCGTGRLLHRGASEKSRLTGIDLSPLTIKRARALAKEVIPDTDVTYYVADAESLPFSDNSYDLVLCSCLLFLMPAPEKVVREMKRVLTTSGRVALLNPSDELTLDISLVLSEEWQLDRTEREALIQWGRIAEKRHRFGAYEIKALLEKYGFRDVFSSKVKQNIGLITIAYAE